MLPTCNLFKYDVTIFYGFQIEWNILKEKFITLAKAKFFICKVFVDSLILGDKMNIREYAKLLNLKQVTILGLY